MSSLSEPARKSCTLKRVHSPHKWWSRQHQMYFRCSGRAVRP